MATVSYKKDKYYINLEYIWTGIRETGLDIYSKTKILYFNSKRDYYNFIYYLYKLFNLENDFCNDSNDIYSKLIQKVINTSKFTTDEIWSETRLQENILKYIPEWSFDGSSTGHLKDEQTEIILKPVRAFPDPFKLLPNLMILCECFVPQLINSIINYNPHISNFRYILEQEEKSKRERDIWIGLEQEYIIFPNNISKSLIPQSSLLMETDDYYCNSGCHLYGRNIAEEHLEKCLYSGLTVSGINSEVSLFQWEYQIGPEYPLKIADMLIVSRYILKRITEKNNIILSFEPKPFPNLNVSGCHLNFSTNDMRTGILFSNNNQYNNLINNLKQFHFETIQNYGKNNEKIMNGLNKTSNYNNFSIGVGKRNVSIRIPIQTFNEKKGYLEDRRPLSNIQPYKAIYALIKLL